MSEEQEKIEPGTFIGVCTECHSDQPAQYMERTKFMEPPCRFCGGVVNIIAWQGREKRDRFLAQHDAERGLGNNTPDEGYRGTMY
jgi:hypothetical protein